MIKSEFNIENNYLHIEYFGSISSSDMLTSIIKISENNELPRNLKILLDARQAEFKHEISDVENAVALLREKIETFDLINEAIIVDKPMETAFSMMFQKLTLALGGKFIVKIFIKQAAAMKWLLIKN